jgi:hypothetical protein
LRLKSFRLGWIGQEVFDRWRTLCGAFWSINTTAVAGERGCGIFSEPKP